MTTGRINQIASFFSAVVVVTRDGPARSPLSNSAGSHSFVFLHNREPRRTPVRRNLPRAVPTPPCAAGPGIARFRNLATRDRPVSLQASSADRLQTRRKRPPKRPLSQATLKSSEMLLAAAVVATTKETRLATVIRHAKSARTKTDQPPRVVKCALPPKRTLQALSPNPEGPHCASTLPPRPTPTQPATRRNQTQLAKTRLATVISSRQEREPKPSGHRES